MFAAVANGALVVIDGAHSLVWSRGDGPKADGSGQPASSIRRGGRGSPLARRSGQAIPAP
ncbi:hypothetical protein [Caulobacter sp. DWP3-1-3b2]|uniref:hypothetical protein n=1 Tax=Caulobacter sp. DWP3-1-3b2 TaxID=2804643 RepID=UPI003CF069AA